MAKPPVRRAVSKPANGAPGASTNGRPHAEAPKPAHPEPASEKSALAPSTGNGKQAMEAPSATPKPDKRAESIQPTGAPAPAVPTHSASPQGRHLHITFRRSGNLERDKFRLKEIYDYVRDPRGRDRFFIRLDFNGQAHELTFPNDACNVSERLVQHLTKHFRLEVSVGEDK